MINDVSQWTFIWYNTLFVLTLIICLKLVVKQKDIKVFSHIFTYVVVLFSVILISNYPILFNTDKEAYQNVFLDINNKKITEFKDFGWGIYNYLISVTTASSYVFFLITSIIYIFSYHKFTKSIVKQSYILLFAFIISFGFIGYATNTIRSGFALSMILLGLSYKENNLKSLFFSIIAILIHKSTFILVFSLYITKKIIKTKYYLYTWATALLITIIAGSRTQFIIGKYLVDYDNRIDSYILDTTDMGYNAGFRLDFLFYSIIPIIIGYIYIYKYLIKDLLYNQLYNTYLIVNSFWLLIIRVNYSDRFAYLSWFLMPFILLYPLLVDNEIRYKKRKIAIILLFIFSFSYLIYFTKN